MNGGKEIQRRRRGRNWANLWEGDQDVNGCVAGVHDVFVRSSDDRRAVGQATGDRRQATVLEAGRQPRRADRRSRPLQVSQLLFCQALSHPPAQNRAPVRPPRRWVGPRRQGNHHPSGLRWQAAWPRSGRWAVPSTGVAAVRPTGGTTTAWLPLQPYLGLQQVSSRLAAPSPPTAGRLRHTGTRLLCHTQPSCFCCKACFCPSCGLGGPARCSGTSGSKSSSPKHPILAGSRSRGALSGPLSHTHTSLCSRLIQRAPGLRCPALESSSRDDGACDADADDDKTSHANPEPKRIPPTAFLPLSRVSTAHHNSGRAQPSSLTLGRPAETDDGPCRERAPPPPAKCFAGRSHGHDHRHHNSAARISERRRSLPLLNVRPPFARPPLRLKTRHPHPARTLSIPPSSLLPAMSSPPTSAHAGRPAQRKRRAHTHTIEGEHTASKIEQSPV